MELTVIFPSLEDLNKYLEAIQHNGLIHDYTNLSLTGKFEEKQIQLAENVFHAVVIKAK